MVKSGPRWRNETFNTHCYRFSTLSNRTILVPFLSLVFYSSQLLLLLLLL